MDGTPQRRAVHRYRSRLAARGLVRFEVQARADDRELIRALARRLAEDGPAVGTLRAALRGGLADAAPRRGSVYAALRRSPLVGAELDLSRPRIAERDVGL